VYFEGALGNGTEILEFFKLPYVPCRPQGGLPSREVLKNYIRAF